jgi:hypothetical protein
MRPVSFPFLLSGPGRGTPFPEKLLSVWAVSERRVLAIKGVRAGRGGRSDGRRSDVRAHACGHARAGG